MDRQELESKVLEMVSIAFKTDVGKLSLDTRFKNDLGGASVQMVGLVAEVENELDVALMLSDAGACATVGDFVNLIEAEM